MSQASRDLIKSLTPENRNIVLLLQMRMGHYLDGEITICKRVSVVRQNGVELICPMGSRSISRMQLNPLSLNIHGELVAAAIPLQGGVDFLGSLDIMVGAEELARNMRTVSALKNKPAALKGVDVAVGGKEMPSSEPDVQINPDILMTQRSIERRLVGPWDGEGWDEGMDEETRYNRIRLAEIGMGVGVGPGSYQSQPKHAPTGMGRIGANRLHGETEFNDSHGLGILQVNPAVLATIEEWACQESRSATAAMMMNKSPLKDSEYFHRKMHLGIEPKGRVGRTPIIGFWTRMGWKWENFKERVAESRVVHFFKSLFNR